MFFITFFLHPYRNAVPGQHFLSALFRFPELQRQPLVQRLRPGGRRHRCLPNRQLFLCHHRQHQQGCTQGRQKSGESRVSVDLRWLHGQRGRGGVVYIAQRQEDSSQNLGRCHEAGSAISGRPAFCSESKTEEKNSNVKADDRMLLATSTSNSGLIDLFSLFFRQCAELQGFVRPLLELLNGLKTGRFDRGKHPSFCRVAFKFADAEHGLYHLSSLGSFQLLYAVLTMSKVQRRI